MSLKGLDSPDVQAAYQTAIAEAAGWFLLQYVSRDGVELLAKGRNGVSEARNAITAYTQPSPLYGLIIYRRRRTLIKYIPESTSRLLQARTSVHFQDILERYSPYETLLEITTGEALNDTALAKTFQLHTASPSPSVGRLDEITEDGEDAGADLATLASANASTSSLSGAQRYKAARRADNLSRRAERSTASLQVRGDSPRALSRHSTPPASPLNPTIAQHLVRESSGQTSITEPELAADNGLPDVAVQAEQSPARTADLLTTAAERLEQESVRETEAQRAPEEAILKESAPEDPLTAPTPDLLQDDGTELPVPESPGISEATPSTRGVSMDDDPYDLRKYDKYFKPKVKLGPRPVTAAERALRTGSARVSAVPASLKQHQQRKQEPSRPKSQGLDTTTPPVTAVEPEPSLRPPPIPDEYHPRPYSRGSVASAPSHRSTGMTPDRRRLMKAVELRKRQLRKSQEPSSFNPPVEEDIPEMPRTQQSPVAAQLTPDINTAEAAQQRNIETEHVNTDDEGQSQSIKADSGIEIRYDTPSYDDADDGAPLLHEATRPVPNARTAMNPTVIDDQSVSAPSPATSDTTETVPVSEPPKEAMPIANDRVPAESTAGHEHVDQAAPAIAAIDPPNQSLPTMPDGDAQAGASVVASSPSSDTLCSADAVPKVIPVALSRPANSDLSRRRRGLVEPLHIDISSGNPDDFMSDDEFLEELHTATVQEARPVFVARSPLSGPSPNDQPSMDDVNAVRSVSIARNISAISTQRSQSELDGLSPEPSPALRSTSPSDKADPAWNAPRKVSSGISRRIQALNEVSTREANVSGFNVATRPLTPESLPNTFLRQDHKGRGPRRVPSPAARPVSFRKPSKNSSASLNIATSPPSENGPIWNMHHDPVTSRNSVSVKARIVRPRMEPSQEPLVQSELMINPSRDQSSKANLNLAPIDADTAQQFNVSSATLSSVSRRSSDTRTLHSASRFGRRGQTSTTSATPEMDDILPPPDQSMSTDLINDENGVPKTSTRTSRFFKRVSNLSGPKRRRSAQSAVSTASFVSLESGKGSTAVDRASVATHRSDTPPAVVVGDLNVQFPDSLLWKRRIVTINEGGYLEFAIAHPMEIHKGVALRHFPLQGFNAPYAPDLDRQELANSVVLELQDGATLQLACEDSMTQRQVLHLLKSYWKSWTAT